MRRTLNAKLTYEDYASIPADGKIYQILDGEVFVTPAPSPFHQRASKRLERQLERYFEDAGRAEVFNSPIDLILSPHDIAQPDLAVVTDRWSVVRRGIEAPPLLVVEVLSPSTERLDRGTKGNRYAAFGVAHYWLLDADTHRLECFKLVEGVYELVVSADGDTTLLHPDFESLAIDLAAIWR
jgi:Uma2 family endonuclease